MFISLYSPVYVYIFVCLFCFEFIVFLFSCSASFSCLVIVHRFSSLLFIYFLSFALWQKHQFLALSCKERSTRRKVQLNHPTDYPPFKQVPTNLLFKQTSKKKKKETKEIKQANSNCTSQVLFPIFVSVLVFSLSFFLSFFSLFSQRM